MSLFVHRGRGPKAGDPHTRDDGLFHGLCAEYRFLEGAGAKLHCSGPFRGAAYDATLNGGTWTSGPNIDRHCGRAVLFDGATDYASIASNPAIRRPYATGKITVEVLWRFSGLDTQYDCLAIHGTNVNNGGWGMQMRSAGRTGEVEFWATTNAAGNLSRQTTTLDDDYLQWRHYVGTFNGTKALIYQNGVAGTLASSSTTLTEPTGSQPVELARAYSAAYTAPGTMALFRIWDRCLSTDEVHRLYADTFTVFERRLLFEAGSAPTEYPIGLSTSSASELYGLQSGSETVGVPAISDTPQILGEV